LYTLIYLHLLYIVSKNHALASLSYLHLFFQFSIMQCYALILPYGADDGEYEIIGCFD